MQETLDALFRHGARGRCFVGDGVVSIVAESVEGERLRWRIDKAGASAVGEPGRVTAEVTGLECVYRMSLDDRVIDEDLLITSHPRAITRFRHRWMRRVEPSGLEASFVIGRDRHRGVVRDISYEGLSIEFSPSVAMLHPGTRIASLQVGDSVVEAVVRRISPTPSGCVCGVEVITPSTSFIDLADEHLHPDTCMGSEWTEHLWQLYETCGYFHLSGKEPAAFQRNKSAFVQVARQLDAAPEVGFHVVWPLREPAAATAALSALKIYDRAWLGLHMAKIKGDIEGVSGRKILRDIHLHAYERIQLDPNAAWIIGYSQVKPVWSNLVHYNLPMRQAPAGEADIVRFRALELDATNGPKPSVPREIDIGMANKRESQLVAFELTRLRSSIYCDALDLVPERISLGQIRTVWERVGLQRDRAILVARKNDELIAAAVLELAEEGTHLFGLLDLVRLYAFKPEGESVFPALLGTAKSWFKKQGRTRFVCLLEEGTPLPDECIARATDLGEAHMTILAAHRIPELLEEVYQVTAPRT